MENFKLKNVSEYTEQELINLTEEQIEKIKKLAIAESGQKLLKRPEEPAYSNIPKPDKQVFGVKLFDAFFEKRETAEELQKFLRSNYSQIKSKNWENDSSYVYVRSIENDGWSSIKLNDISVNIIDVYSPELHAQISDKIKTNKSLKERYDKQLSEYNEYVESVKEIVENIDEKIQEARDKDYEKKNKLMKFQEYLDLAEQNTDIAWKFMKKAYVVSVEEEDYIKANI